MNFYDVTTGNNSVSYPVPKQGRMLRNGRNYGNLHNSNVVSENEQPMCKCGVRMSDPYDLWLLTQNPWKLLLQHGGVKVAKDAPEKLSEDTGNPKVSVLSDVENIPDGDMVNALLAEKTSCTYPFETEDGELLEMTYFTFYEKDRIYCMKEGGDGYEWEMPLEDGTQYEKVMAFLEHQTDKENMRFASQQIFWQDYLSGKLDEEGFQKFLNTRVEKGIPNYANVTEDGTYIDKEAVQFCKYMDKPFGEIIATTDKEFLDWNMNKLMEKALKMGRDEVPLSIVDMVEYHYRMFGDRGKRIYNYHGKLLTFEEFYPLDLQDAREAFAKTGGEGVDDYYARNGWTTERFNEFNSQIREVLKSKC